MHLPWRWILKKYRANWNKLNDNQLDRSSTSKLHNAKRRTSIRSNLQQIKTKNKMKGFILTLHCKINHFLDVVQVFKGMQTLTPPLLIPKLVLFMLLPTLDRLPPHFDSMNFISPPSSHKPQLSYPTPHPINLQYFSLY